jgi:hypothetical protein
MTKKQIIPVVVFTVYLCLAHIPRGNETFLADANSQNQQINLRNESILEQFNRIALAGIAAEDNFAAGFFEATPAENMVPYPREHLKAAGLTDFQAGEELASFHRDTEPLIAAYEKALGIRVNTNPDNELWRNYQAGEDTNDPTVQRYLERDRLVLDEVVRLVDREFYRTYLYSTNGSMVSGLLPLVPTCRRASRALAVRVDLALRENRVSDALADALAIERLGHKLMVEENMIVSVLAGGAMFSMGNHALCEVISHPHFNHDHLSMIEDSRKRLIGSLGVRGMYGDKIMTLQGVRDFELRGMNGVVMAAGEEMQDEAFVVNLAAALANWDQVYEFFDYKHELCIAVLEEPDFDARRELTASLRSACSEKQVHYSLPTQSAIHFIDDLYCSTTEYVLGGIERFRSNYDCMNVCLAIKKFHLDTGQYPVQLDELIGKYLQDIPRDITTNDPLKYIKFTEGALVYSVGKDKIDSDGWSDENLIWHPGGGIYSDDITYTVGTDDRIAPTGLPSRRTEIPGGKWSKDYGGGWDASSLIFYGKTVSDSDLETIFKLSTLEYLDFNKATLPDQWHRQLPRLEKLSMIDLSNTLVDDAFLRSIAKLPNLRILILNAATIEGDLSVLEAAEQLSDLQLARTDINDQSMEQISKIKSLESLTLTKTVISSVGVSHLTELPNLKGLDLSYTEITDHAAAMCLEIKTLEWLELDYTSITDSAFQEGKPGPNLTALGLNGTNVTAAVLPLVSSVLSVDVYHTEIPEDLNAEFTAGDEHQLPETTKTQKSEPFGDAGIISGMNYKLLTHEFPLSIELISSNSPGTSKSRVASILKDISGDFEMTVKVSPDWDSYDRIVSGSDQSEVLFAGLIAMDTDGHSLLWGWNHGHHGLMGSVNGASFARHSSSPTPMYNRDGYLTARIPMPFIASGSVWLRLQRRGAVFIASRSSDGHVWSVTSTSKTTLGDDLKIGLRCYFNSHGYESRQATFKVTVDQFSIQQ